MGPHDVTNVVHDHTSVLATIERQWNLPALTYRDANAATLVDFLDPSVMAFAEPPTSPPPPTLARTGPGLYGSAGAADAGIHGPDGVLIGRSHRPSGGSVRYVTLVSGKRRRGNTWSGRRGGRNAH
jgi:hypothetical protein